MNRTKDGRLQADPERFPSGIKRLADYVSFRSFLFYKFIFTHFSWNKVEVVDLITPRNLKSSIREAM